MYYNNIIVCGVAVDFEWRWCELGFIFFIRYNIVYLVVDFFKSVFWDILNFFMNFVRYIIEDDESLDRIYIRNLGFVCGVIFEVFIMDSGMIDSELLLVFGIMFE